MHLVRTLSATVAALGLALAGVTLAATTPVYAEEAPAGEITWGIVPATAEGVPDSRVSFRLQVPPGATLTEHALLTNYSPTEVTFGIQGADGVVGEDGAFDVLPPDVESKDIGSWMTVQDSVVLAPGASALIPFIITVPENATPGDHPGGLVASVTQVGDTADGPSVGLTTRVGVRIHLRVPGDLAPSIAFSDVETRYEYSLNPFQPGTLHLSYTVANDGNVRVGSIQQADATGPFGLPTGAVGPSGSVVGQQREILPGQDTRVSTELTGVWPLAFITTSLTGSLETVGDDVPLGKLALEASDAGAWAIPWPQLIVLAVLVLLVLAALRLRGVQRRRHEAALAKAREEGARAAASASPASTQ